MKVRVSSVSRGLMTSSPSARTCMQSRHSSTSRHSRHGVMARSCLGVKAGDIPLSPCRHGSEIQLGAEVLVAATVKSVLLPGQRLVVQSVLPGQCQRQAAAVGEGKLLLYTRVQALEAPLVQMIGTIVDQAGAYLPRPLPQPGRTAGVP